MRTLSRVRLVRVLVERWWGGESKEAKWVAIMDLGGVVRAKDDSNGC